MLIGCKRFAGGTLHCASDDMPDLRRLTRHVLQVAELLPWPVKDELLQDQFIPYGMGSVVTKVFWRGQS